FEDGYGIKAGDTLNFRGIDVGEVTNVDVNTGLSNITVHVELQQNALDLARTGSQFWIERPQLGLGRISGLDTVVGAKYLGVIPGEETAEACFEFVGIESPPVIRDGTGRDISIQFEDGYGIATGAVVRHLGIVVGEVTAVQLAEKLDSVTVSVRLSGAAANAARSGSQFWIERPELGLSEIRGLATLISGPYIDFLPGPAQAPLVRHFQGAEYAPPAKKRSAEGLELVLTSDQQRALRAGVPVNYRGLKVGHVVSARLASDASSIQARVFIEPAYKELVRVDSQFWSNIGVDADFGVTGIQLKTDSLQSLAVGSVSFATPDRPGRKARTGDRFDCNDSYQENWLAWTPKIAIGEQMLPLGKNRPDSFRSILRWKEKSLTFTRKKQRQGWLVLLENGQLIGLPRYLQPPEERVADSTMLEMSGAEFPYIASRAAPFGSLFCYELSPQKIDQKPWPVNQLRRPESPEDCLIVSDPQAAAVPLASTNIDSLEDDRWLINPALSYPPELDGAIVVSRTDGALIGFLDLSRGQAEVTFVPEQ
ncbi:MAG: MlaD family protein, partial [Pirellulaceae bacterium]|nr:MlaD family protein [Pirellulaceae bacterium]